MGNRGGFSAFFQVAPLLLICQNAVLVGALSLNCNDWNTTCAWHNVPGATITWYRSSANITADQMLMTTGTSALPNSSYAIATSISANTSIYADLLSDLVPCQYTNATLSFSYWTSPFVLLTVCVVVDGVALNRSSGCTRVSLSQGPGPAVVPILVQPAPFRLMIETFNFVYANGQLTGGFAILDNLVYTGDYCTTPAPTTTTTNATTAANSTVSNSTNSTVSNSTAANSTVSSGNGTTNGTAPASNATNPANSTATGTGSSTSSNATNALAAIVGTGNSTSTISATNATMSSANGTTAASSQNGTTANGR